MQSPLSNLNNCEVLINEIYLQEKEAVLRGVLFMLLSMVGEVRRIYQGEQSWRGKV